MADLKQFYPTFLHVREPARQTMRHIGVEKARNSSSYWFIKETKGNQCIFAVLQNFGFSLFLRVPMALVLQTW